MKLTLARVNAKVFAKALQCLAKFSTELFMEIGSNGLQIRALNFTRSAIGTFQFRRSFFEKCSLGPDAVTFNFKIATKACLSAFKNMKNVEVCEMEIHPNDTRLKVQFLSLKLETTKTSLISIIEEESVTASVSPGAAVNIVSGPHSVFTRITNNFNVVEEELTFDVNSETISAQNYIEGTRVHDKFMRSQLKLPGAAFEEYRIVQDATVTFCLKEFKAFLTLAELLNVHFSLRFSETGSPVFVALQQTEEFEGSLIMSTLAETDLSFHEEYRRDDSASIQQPLSAPSSPSELPSSSGPRAAKERRLATDSTLSVDSGLFPIDDSVDVPSLALPRNKPPSAGGSSDAFLSLAPPAHLTRSYHSATQAPLVETVSLAADEEDECINDSPERHAHQIRSVFSRCFQATYVAPQPSPTSQMYAPNSDAEDDGC